MRAIALVLLGALLGAALIALPAADSKPRRVSKRVPQKVKVIRVKIPGPRGARGPTGPQGPAGPQGGPGAAGAPGTDLVRSLTINWRGDRFAGHDSASTEIPGVGTVTATCSPEMQRLALTPSSPGARTVAVFTTHEGAGTAATSTVRKEHPAEELVLQLPPNGMVTGTFSIQPINGDGGPVEAPATLMLSSEFVVNDAQRNFCFVAAQLVRGAS